jgi:dihydrolipoamide dehydrogenase
VGRSQQTFGYEEVGVTMDRGYVITNELLTSVPNVYAVGDIVPGLQLAHRGFQHGIFVAEEIAAQPDRDRGCQHPERSPYPIRRSRLSGSPRSKRRRSTVPNVTVYDYNLAGNGKSHIIGTSGSIKVIRMNDGPIVGMHMIGARVGNSSERPS